MKHSRDDISRMMAFGTEWSMAEKDSCYDTLEDLICMSAFDGCPYHDDEAEETVDNNDKKFFQRYS